MLATDFSRGAYLWEALTAASMSPTTIETATPSRVLDSLDRQQQGRDWKLADVWSPTTGHDVKRGDLLSTERLADFAAGAVLGVVFVLVTLGVGMTCRLFLCRSSRAVRPRYQAVDIVANEADLSVAETEAMIPEFSYTDLERERLQRLKEESRQQPQQKRKWWQSGRGRHEEQPTNHPQTTAPHHDVEEGPKGALEGEERKSCDQTPPRSLLLFGKWSWAPAREPAAEHGGAPLAVTQLDDASPSPPWKRRASDVVPRLDTA
ncbi:uncharacterized protein ACA1_104010 [Acanthamoeba castellanii str. Neff]|uniref:Transmembrane protein n=1 Tax=Acanthamoeba castellanii (strain ATCC 30010 / Neff) TaxID=1257118 RepID=L8GE34_ACACF|nr:uncharacterized protein ACA1_104010 [Acanthamoeba castellanii str. Neff]ELR10983.1 hypothetical protein ACA1_104010 [Acanthamoeba castellanii str. Neff]